MSHLTGFNLARNNVRRWVSLVLTVIVMTGCTLSSTEDSGESVALITGAPTVELATPLANSTFLKGVVVNIIASVANAGTDLQRVEFKVNDAKIAEVNAPNPSGAARFSVTNTWTPDTAGVFTVEVIAYRADGSSSQPATIQVNVVDELPKIEPSVTPQPTTDTGNSAVTQPTQQQQVVNPPTATNTVVVQPTAEPTQQPTEDPATQAVVVRVVQGGMNVRSGPSTNFVPVLGVLPGNEDVPILAANPAGSWYKINFNGGIAWISSDPSLVTLVSGDPATLPREVGPAIPTLQPTAPPIQVQPTAAPGQPTQPPATGGDGVNLVITGFELRQGSRPVNTIFINEPAVAFVKVKNAGTQDTPTGFFVLLRIVNKDDGGFLLEEAAAFSGVLKAGEEYTLQIPFTDKAGAGLTKSAAAIVDNNNQIPETNEGDNNSPFAIEYVLGAQ